MVIQTFPFQDPQWGARLAGTLVRYRSGVSRLELFPQSYDGILDILLRHARPILVFTNVRYVRLRGKGYADESLADLARSQGAGCHDYGSRADPEIIALNRQDLRWLLDGVYQWNLDCWDALRTPPFLCIDLEGGTVDRLRDLVAHVPDVASVAATGSRREFQRHGRLIGDEIRAFGFNVDFAPVLDIGFEPSRRVLTSRTASDDPEKVTRFAEAFTKGLTKAGVLGCGKHFPGLGEGSLDTHKTMTVIRKPLKKLWNEDLVPYRALKELLPMIMVAHAAYPEVTHSNEPASLSSLWMRDVLRRKIGYRGVVVSDDMEMGASTAQGTIEEVSVASLHAGMNVLSICHTEELIWRAHEAVLREAEKDRRFATVIDAACARVLALKAKNKAVQNMAPSPTGKRVEELRLAVHAFRSQIMGELPL